MTLTKAGLAKVSALAAALYSRAAPQNEAAFALDGVLYAAPAFQESTFSGDIQLTRRNMNSSQAALLADEINLARTAN